MLICAHKMTNLTDEWTGQCGNLIKTWRLIWSLKNYMTVLQLRPKQCQSVRTAVGLISNFLTKEPVGIPFPDIRGVSQHIWVACRQLVPKEQTYQKSQKKLKIGFLFWKLDYTQRSFACKLIRENTDQPCELIHNKKKLLRNKQIFT